VSTGRAVVSVVPGAGILVRRPAAVFFSPVAPDDESIAALLLAFESAADDGSASAAVTEAVVAAAFEAAPFAVVTWTGGLELVVLGGVEVRTDHPTLPMLSGAGSGSWVERRLGTLDGTVTVSVGGPVDDGTDLALGRVRAGGFAAIVTAAAHRTPSADDVQPPRPAAMPAEPDTGVDNESSGRRLEGLAALRAATGGDWMEESLGLGPPDASAASAGVSSPGSAAGVYTGDVDDEVTLGGDDEPLPAAIGAPPPWPGDDAPAVPEDVDRDRGNADNSTAGEPPAERRLVPSRHCPADHPNPPLADVCRECGAAIDAGAPTVAVRQPPLGRLRLGDGESSAIDRALVLGRRPDAGAAGMPAGSRLIAVSSEASVSRTHAVVRAEGWTVTVTDCGSRSGTAVLMPGGDEPLLLQPWIPHEVAIGTQIFLGGPTSVSVEPAGGAPP
jgi:hypothetical protein